jgi:hypothetical protein
MIRPMRATTIVALILGGLPLVVYPAVLVASFMGLAGHRTGNEAWWEIALANTFYLGTIAYPLLYIAGLIFALVMRKRERPRAGVVASVAPLAFLALLAIAAASVLEP